MMSSLGSDKARPRGRRGKGLPAPIHASQPQKQMQATVEQIRLAQMIYDKNDAYFEGKVNQLMEVTGKTQDECMIALHDCNGDVSRAINFVLEGTSDLTPWETVSRKRPLLKERPSNSRENSVRKRDKDSSKGRASSNRKSKGANRSRQARPEENGVAATPVEKGSRARRLRGNRGSGGRSKTAGSRFSAQGMGTFNPADYTSEAKTGTKQTVALDSNCANNSTDGPDAPWNSVGDRTHDWSEDVSLPETQGFTSSCSPALENRITPGESLDHEPLLHKPVGGGREPPSSSSLVDHTQLVYTNSHQQLLQQQPAPPSCSSTSSTSYTNAALSSVLGAGFGDLGQAKRPQTSTGEQILEQPKGPGLGQRRSFQARPPVGTQGNDISMGQLPGLGAPVPPPPPSSWVMKTSESSTSLSSQFSREFGLQSEHSLLPSLSQLVQRHSGPNLPSPCQSSPPSQQPASSTLPSGKQTGTSPHADSVISAPGAKPPAPSAGLDPQGGSTPPQQQRAQLKGQKRRIPPTSKIPSTAVEMPGVVDILGLNLQFGALDFGSESALPDFGARDNCLGAGSTETIGIQTMPRPATAPPAPRPGTQSQTPRYSNPLSETLSSSLTVALPPPLSSQEPEFHSSSVVLPGLPSSSLGTSSFTHPSSPTASTRSTGLSSAHFSSVGGAYNGTIPSHTRLTLSQEATGPVMNGVRTSAALDTSSASSTPNPGSPSLNIGNGGTIASLEQNLVSANQLSSFNSNDSRSSVSTMTSISYLADRTCGVVPKAYGSGLLDEYASVDSNNVHPLPPSSGSYTSLQPVAFLSDQNSSNSSGISHPANMHALGSTVSGIAAIGGLNTAANAPSTALGLGSNGATATSNLSAHRNTPLLSSSSTGKGSNLSAGLTPLLPNQYIVGPGGLLTPYPQIYGYEDMVMLQSRPPVQGLQDYYGVQFPGPTANLSGRHGSLANNPYSGEVSKFGRNDSTSPVPPTSLPAPQPPQGQPQGQGQAQHHNSQQAFLPPAYNYTGLPYYAGVPGNVPNAAAFQFGPAMFVSPGGPGPASAKQHNMGLGLGLNLGTPCASPFQQQTQQQPSGFAQHGFSSGYEELTAGPAGVDFSKGYNSSSQAQPKSAAAGPGKGVSVTSSNSGVPDISGSVYNKTQSFDKQGFPSTPPPFNLPSTLGGPGPLNPGAAPGGYAPAPFVHIVPHQQPHSQLLHHPLAQDGQGGPNHRGQSSTLQQKSQVNKSSYGSSPYWAN